MPIHLLFPLFSSIMFVLGMMLVKQAIDRGVSPWTGTFLGNLWLALTWAVIAIVRGEIIPVEGWPDAAIIGVMFVLGQVFTFLAFQFGDVSVATPIFGVKVLIVALLQSLLSGDSVPPRIWLAGFMATSGIVLIQWSGGKLREDKAVPTIIDAARKRGLTIVLALSAATSLSLFDVFMQHWASARWNSFSFLPVMFGTAGVLSLTFLKWVDTPKKVRELKAGRWILGGTLLMALQAMSMCFSLARFGDATRINIVYALRGLWGVILAWLLGRLLGTSEGTLGKAVMLRRLGGAILLTSAVLLAMTG